MSHVRTSPYDPQRNGKTERWHNTIKQESIRTTAKIVNLQWCWEIVIFPESIDGAC